jgi:hypothetical protein
MKFLRAIFLRSKVLLVESRSVGSPIYGFGPLSVGIVHRRTDSPVTQGAVSLSKRPDGLVPSDVAVGG